MTSALIASWAAILLLALVVSGLVRQVHQLSRETGGRARAPQHPGIRPGSAAPGSAELLGEHRAGVLLFLSPECRTCTDVLAEAGRWGARYGEDAPAVHALYAGPAPATKPTPSAPPVSAERDDLFALYDAVATPFAVVVDDTGRVLRSEPLGSVAALPELLDDAFPRPARSA